MKPKNAILLLLTATIWGVALVAQAQAADHIGAFTFNCVRSFLGGLSLLPVIFVMQLMRRSKAAAKDSLPEKEKGRRTLFVGGILCGICLFGGSFLQQLGIERSSVGKAGFITALYIVLVPIATILLHHLRRDKSISQNKRITLPLLGSVTLALIGLFLLCVQDTFVFESGDILLILCALCFTAQILVIDHFSPMVDGVKLSCLEFFTTSLISLPGMLLIERPRLAELSAAVIPLLYAGIASCGIAYTLQILGQRDTPPALASLLMSFESVFAVVFGILLLKQVPTAREIFGCVLMFIAIVAAQRLPDEEEV